MRRLDGLAALKSDAEHVWFTVFLGNILEEIARQLLLAYIQSLVTRPHSIPLTRSSRLDIEQ